jgi:hypothetical protein
VDDPTNNLAGPPIDVGAGDDFGIDVWVRALPGGNTAPAIGCGANDNWRLGNILIDRRRTGGAGYGISIAGGRVAFGVTGPGTGSLTVCGTTDVTDGQWHLITVVRNRWAGQSPDGAMWLFVDGQLQAPEAAGPGGDMSFPDSAVPTSPADPFLVLGADKFGGGAPGFAGWIDELRFSNIIRTKVSFTRPAAPYVADANTLALFHFNEGSGDVIYDTSGFTAPPNPPGGPSSAQRLAAGAPLSPEWSNEYPFGIAPTPSPSPTAPASPIPSTATATATTTSAPSATPSPSATASPTVAPSAAPTVTATAEATATTAPSVTNTSPAAATPTLSPSPTSTATSLPTATPIPSATPGGTGLPGDISLDGLVNVIDTQLCVNVILGSETDPGVVARADVTQDGSVNVLDIQAIVNIILAG